MRIEQCEDGSLDVFVRQSWINEAIMCPERGRYGIIDPDASLPNELTVLGTAVHAGIAADLTAKLESPAGGGLPVDDVIAIAYQAWADEAALPMKWVGKANAHQIHAFIPELTRMYYKGLRHHVIDEVVAVEMPFSVHLDTFTLTMPNGENREVRIHGKGTIDYVGNGVVKAWDWKTAGQPYKAWEKQRQAAQPSMYSAAVVAMGLAEWPVRFNYGVLVRDKSHQIVPILRTPGHVKWMLDEIRPFIRMQMFMGLEESWPKNDTGYLCSERWCSWYQNGCKGRSVSESDMVTWKDAA